MTEWAIARLIKRSTADGLVEMEDHIPLGKLYRVNLDTRQRLDGFNLIHRKVHRREWIADDTGRFIPTELLEIQNDT